MLCLKNRKRELERASIERKFPAFSSFGGHVLCQFISSSTFFFEKENFSARHFSASSAQIRIYYPFPNRTTMHLSHTPYQPHFHSSIV